MAKTIKENDENTFEIQAWKLLTMLHFITPEDSRDILEIEDYVSENMEKMLKLNGKKVDAFEVVDFKLVKSYFEKIPWYKLPVSEVPDKVFHPIITIKNDDKETTLGYSNAQNTLTFSKNNGPIRYFKFTQRDIKDQLGQFSVILKKLLK